MLSNYVQLIGRLGQDVKYQTLDNGNSLAQVSIAIREVRRDAAGSKQVETTWHQLVGWGKVAEMMQVFLKKGSPVVVQGRLRKQTYGEGEERRYHTEIVVREFQVMQ